MKLVSQSLRRIAQASLAPLLLLALSCSTLSDGEHEANKGAPAIEGIGANAFPVILSNVSLLNPLLIPNKYQAIRLAKINAVKGCPIICTQAFTAGEMKSSGKIGPVRTVLKTISKIGIPIIAIIMPTAG